MGIGISTLNNPTPPAEWDQQYYVDHQPAIDTIYNQMDTAIGTAKPGSGSPGNRPQDVQDQLRLNAETFHKAGYTTPELVDQFTTRNWLHDRKVAVGVGMAKNATYGIVIGAMLDTVVPKLADKVKDPAAFGAAFGTIVGAADDYFADMAGAIPEALMRNGRAGSNQMPDSVRQQTSEFKQFATDVLRGTIANLAKNAPRLAAPWLQDLVEKDPRGLIDSAVASKFDFALDAGDQIVAGAIKEYLKLRPQERYVSDMYLRKDLQSVIDKSNRTWGATVKDMGKGVVDAVTQLFRSPVKLAVIGAYTASITGLNVTNEAIKAQGAQDFQNQHNETLPAGKIPWDVLTKTRFSSWGQVGLLNITAPVIATLVEKGSAAIAEKVSCNLTEWSKRFQARPPDQQNDGAMELGNIGGQIIAVPNQAVVQMQQDEVNNEIAVESNHNYPQRPSAGHAGQGGLESAQKASSSGGNNVTNPSHSLFCVRRRSSNSSSEAGGAEFKTPLQSPTGSGSTFFGSASSSPLPSRSGTPKPNQ